MLEEFRNCPSFRTICCWIPGSNCFTCLMNRMLWSQVTLFLGWCVVCHDPKWFCFLVYKQNAMIPSGFISWLMNRMPWSQVALFLGWWILCHDPKWLCFLVDEHNAMIPSGFVSWLMNLMPWSYVAFFLGWWIVWHDPKCLYFLVNEQNAIIPSGFVSWLMNMPWSQVALCLGWWICYDPKWLSFLVDEYAMIQVALFLGSWTVCKETLRDPRSLFLGWWICHEPKWLCVLVDEYAMITSGFLSWLMTMQWSNWLRFLVDEQYLTRPSEIGDLP